MRALHRPESGGARGADTGPARPAIGAIAGGSLRILTILMLSACGTDEPGRAAAARGTTEMVARLQDIYRDALADPVPYLHLNHRRVELWRRDLAQTPAVAPEVRSHFVYELLNAGELDEAIRQIPALLTPSGGGGFELTSRSKPLYDLLGVAYLRRGMRPGCVADPTEHCRQSLSQATSLYAQLLAAFPDDVQTRWLLNLAYAALGQYPDRVPEPWVIPGLTGSAGAAVPRFPDVAPALGLAVDGMAGGVSLEDFDRDGLIDVFVTAWGLNDPARLFLADGRGGFVDATERAGLRGIVGGLNTIHADYDNDGDADILILRGAWLGAHGAHPNSLLRNRGDGSFDDVTAAAGLLSFHPTQTAAWGDFNNDGLLDLFVGNESGGRFGGMGGPAPAPAPGTAEEVHPSELFLNRGDGTFTEIAAQVGIDVTDFVKGVAWGDVNNDGLPDLFVSVMGGANRLYLNHGGTGLDDWRFEEVGAAAGVREPDFSFPCWFWDLDNDGWEDLFVASYDPREREAAGTVAREFLRRDVRGEPARAFRNDRDGTFTDVAVELGLDRARYVMGANHGDLDNDGYPDVYVGTGAPDLRALIPDARPENAWLVLRLEGRTANRSAIGARIRIIVAGRDGERRTIHGTVSTGGSFGASSLQQEIGLGPTTRIEELRVTWPTRQGSVDVYTDLAVNRHYHVVEGEGVRPLAGEPVRLAGSAGDRTR